MPEKLESSQPFARPRESDLDRDRTASMAFEGGAAAAQMELEEELRSLAPGYPESGTSLATRTAVRSWTTRLLWGALAFGAAALFTGLALHFRRR